LEKVGPETSKGLWWEKRKLNYTVSQKKGCHPNHGYNFVNS